MSETPHADIEWIKPNPNAPTMPFARDIVIEHCTFAEPILDPAVLTGKRAVEFLQIMLDTIATRPAPGA